MISVSVPSLALSADVAVRRRHEEHVNFVMRDERRASSLPGEWSPCTKGELAEAVAEVGADELIGERMRPGDVRQHG